MTKEQFAVFAKWGKRGGKARSLAKRKAGRRNVAHARKYLLTEKLCRVCKKNRLGARNKSGVCRDCQRAGKPIRRLRRLRRGRKAK